MLVCGEAHGWDCQPWEHYTVLYLEGRLTSVEAPWISQAPFSFIYTRQLVYVNSQNELRVSILFFGTIPRRIAFTILLTFNSNRLGLHLVDLRKDCEVIFSQYTVLYCTLIVNNAFVFLQFSLNSWSAGIA